MKRIGVFVCLIMMIASIMAPAAFAAENDTADNTASATKAGFTIVSSTPENGASGVSVENLSVKLYFSKEMLQDSKKAKDANDKQFKLTDSKGKEIPIKVYYSHKEKKDGLMMVVSDTIDNNITIEGDTEYTLTIGKGLKASDGTTLGVDQKITFKTLNQKRSTMIYTIMMVVMMAGMIFYTTRATKKAMEKENQAKGKSETVNPYKEAKRTGKSVEEIVAKDQQRKAKEAAAREKQRAKDAEIAAALEETPASSNKRVSGPRPISAAGSEYKVEVVKSQPEKKATNPKGQSGKQKNSKNKSKKKK
ncbi:MAG: Ig-like domain-containing protein [Bacillota bacterium]|nr:Ig-like domain-containing protein [Bacillota bacterium]